LKIELEEKKQNQIVRFKKDMEIQEDKIIPLLGTCYCGGCGEDHIIQLEKIQGVA